MFHLINDKDNGQKSIIKVLGVGGGGSNAVNNMFTEGIVGVDFAICNTDGQAMESSPVPVKIQLGPTLTEGRGAGSKPNIGKLACEESIDDISAFLTDDCKMLFVTAGMGGGTGTGAAPIIAKKAQELDILTIGIVTLPFSFEGKKRISQGMQGVEELRQHVDSLIVISNDKLREIHGNIGVTQGFHKADDVLTMAAKGIAEIITKSGYVNVDFEDVNTVMRDSGRAIMGTGYGEGPDRAKTAIDQALNSPLLEDNNIIGSKHILINITSGKEEVTFDEVTEITDFVQAEAGPDTNLIWGNCFDEDLGGEIMVTIIATGFKKVYSASEKSANEPKRVSLDDDSPKLSTITQNNFEQNDNINAKVYEFDNVRESSSNRQPEDTVDNENERLLREERMEMKRKEEKERQERLSKMKVKLNDPKVLNEMENEPAFRRHGVKLDDVAHSSEQYYSKWSISADDDEAGLKKKNKYLHKDID